MKRFFFWCAAAAVLFVFVFFGLNLFDAKSKPEAPAGLAANLDPGNGFFILWGFAEPPGTDPSAEAFGRRVRELFAAPRRDSHSRSRFGLWLAQLNTGARLHWQGASLYFPQLQEEDIGEYFAARRALVAERQERFPALLLRYRQVLQAGELADFTPLNWEFPSRCSLLATYAARLFAASRVLAAVDGRWPDAGRDLLDAMDAGFKLIAAGRTLAVNSLGKTMAELSLRSLASLLNRPDCPPSFARLVLENLPARPARAFGTRSVRDFNWMSFAAAIERVKRDRIVDPFLLKDYFRDPAAFYAMERFVAISGLRVYSVAHALAAFFLKENETVAMLRGFWENMGRLEETPPWRWGKGARAAGRRTPALGLDAPFWWLRNPLGKMMVSSAIPFSWPVLRHYVNRTHELKARYDLVRLLAQARRAAGMKAELGEAALRRLLSASGERDPFSGSPYRFGREREVLYSLGSDRRDDGGREQPEIWRDSDIAVPIRFIR